MDNEHDKNAENAFKHFGQRIDKFVAELDEASVKLNQEFKERFEELKEAGERLRAEAKNKDRWQEVETRLQRAGEELKKAFDAAFRKKE